MKTFTLKTLQQNADVFKKIISRYYPLSTKLLEKYANQWDWKEISLNRFIPWTDQLVEKFHDKLFAKELPQYMAIPWSVSLINRLIKEKKITWEELMWQRGIFDKPETVSHCLFEWSKGKKIGLLHPQLNNAVSDIRNYRYIQYTDWGKDAVLWAENVVENTKNLYWDLFSGVEGFPWTLKFIEKHKNRLDWDILSGNNNIPWSEEFLEKYEDKLNWNALSINRGIAWNVNLLKKFSERIHWDLMLQIHFEDGNDLSEARTTKLLDIISEIPEKIEWAYPDIDHGFWEGELSGIINNEEIYWTPAFFNEVKSRLELFFNRLEETTFYDWDNNKWYIDFTDQEGHPVNWTYFAKTNNWSPEFFDLMLNKQINEQITTINWEHICTYSKHLWTPAFIEKHKTDIVNYCESSCYTGRSLAANNHFPWMDFFDELKPYLTTKSYEDLSTNPALVLTPEFIETYLKTTMLNLEEIGTRSDLTEEIIGKYLNQWDWHTISRDSKTPIKILQQFPDKINWKLVSNRDDLNFEEMDQRLSWDWEKVFLNNNISIISCIPEFLLLQFLTSPI